MCVNSSSFLKIIRCYELTETILMNANLRRITKKSSRHVFCNREEIKKSAEANCLKMEQISTKANWLFAKNKRDCFRYEVSKSIIVIWKNSAWNICCCILSNRLKYYIWFPRVSVLIFNWISFFHFLFGLFLFHFFLRFAYRGNRKPNGDLWLCLWANF